MLGIYSVDFINYTHLSHEITKAPKTIKNTFFYCRKIFSNACLTYSIYCLAIAFFAPQPFLVLYGTEFFVDGMLSLGCYFIFKPTYLSDKEKMYCTEIAKYIHQFAAIQALKEILELPISEVRNDGNAAYFSSQSKVCGLLNTSYTQYKFQSPEAIKQAFPEQSLARTNLFLVFEQAQYPVFQAPVTDEAS